MNPLVELPPFEPPFNPVELVLSAVIGAARMFLDLMFTTPLGLLFLLFLVVGLVRRRMQ